MEDQNQKENLASNPLSKLLIEKKIYKLTYRTQSSSAWYLFLFLNWVKNHTQSANIEWVCVKSVKIQLGDTLPEKDSIRSHILQYLYGFWDL